MTTTTPTTPGWARPDLVPPAPSPPGPPAGRPPGLPPWPPGPPGAAGPPGGLPPGPGAPPRDRRPPAPGPTAPTRWLLVPLLVVAVAVDLVVHGRIDALAGTLGVVLVGAALLASGRVVRPAAVGLVIVGAGVAVFLTLRTSVWLVPIDALVALGALVLAASYARGGSLVGVTGTTLVVRIGRTFLSIVLAPAFLLGALAAAVPAPTPERRARAVAIGRGLGLAVPALVVLGLLLASADAVFGALFTVPFDLPTASGHVAVVAGGLLVGSFLLVEASSPAVREVGLDARPLGATEATIVLGGVVTLYGVFAAVQVVVAAQGEDAVLRAAGVTYAEHARQGFFQLLAVAALTVAILVALRAFTEAGSRAARLRLVVLSEAAIVLTLVIVGVAITRLGLYEQAFGLTMLRYACTWVAWWLGAVFGLIAVAVTGLGGTRRWLLFAVGLSLLVGWVAFNAVDPEATVARRNLDQVAAGHRLDGQYLAELSDDAVPTVAAAIGSLPPGAEIEARRFVCGPVRSARTPEPPPERPPSAGLDLNTARRQADIARAEVCP